MLYEDIRRGCKDYHNEPRAYDKAYEDYMFIDKAKDKWLQPDTLDLAEAGKLLAFLNQWETLMPVRLIDFHSALQNAAVELTPLMDKTILDLSLSKMSIDDDKKFYTGSDTAKITSIFEKLANCGARNESTATSKILHTINPHGFVMWDIKIRKKYARKLLRRKSPLITAYEYAFHFLPEMQEIANQAVNEVMAKEDRSRDDAIKSLTPCGNTLAKVIDEFNYVNSR